MLKAYQTIEDVHERPPEKIGVAAVKMASRVASQQTKQSGIISV
jgi:hypothetical protein